MAVLNEEDKVVADVHNKRVGTNYHTLVYGSPSDVTKMLDDRVVTENPQTKNRGGNTSAYTTQSTGPSIYNQNKREYGGKTYFSVNPYNTTSNTATKTREDSPARPTQQPSGHTKINTRPTHGGSRNNLGSIHATPSSPGQYAQTREIERRTTEDSYTSADTRTRSYVEPREDRYIETVENVDVVPNSAVRRNNVVSEVETDPSVPTRQTMNHNTYLSGNKVEKSEKMEIGLSVQAKVVIAIIAAVVIIAFTVVFVNSALLNSLYREESEYYASLTSYEREAEELSLKLEEATSEETIINYAEGVGMILNK